MAKMLMISPEKCTGCRACEIGCSFKRKRTPRVKVIKWEETKFSMPIMCFQCDDAACAKVCPVNAISRSEETGAMLVNNEKCIRCKLCVQACPFGNIEYDTASSSIIKCDLCGGDPQCAKFCRRNAITYCENSEGNLVKRKATAEKFKELIDSGSKDNTSEIEKHLG